MRLRNLIAPYALSMMALLFGLILAVGWVGDRDLSRGEGLAEYHTTDGSAEAFLSAGTIGVFTIAFVALFFRVFRKRIPIENSRAATVIGTFLLTNVYLPFAADPQHFFNFGFLVCSVIAFSIALSPPIRTQDFILWTRRILTATLLTSLIGAWLFPSKTVAADYLGLIDSLPFRLYGLGTGATGLGALACALLALGLFGSGRTTTRLTSSALALICLLLTQSKTNWVAGLAIAAVYLLQRAPFRRSTASRGPTKAIFWLTLLVSLASIIAVLVDTSGVPDAANIDTLTGRDTVWRITLQTWEANPIFGYGLGLWAADSFRNLHGDFAHAHNQLLHALGSGGIIAAVGLLAYFAQLYASVARRNQQSEIPLLLLLVLFVNSLTDVPVLNSSVVDPFFALHMMVFTSAFLLRDLPPRQANLGALHDAPRKHLQW